MEFKKDIKPIQRKARLVPIQFQGIVPRELEKLIEKGHMEKADETTKNGYVLPVVITMGKIKRLK